MLSLLLEGASTTGGASDTLAASIITGVVTIVVTLIGVFATRVKAQHDHNKANPPPPQHDPHEALLAEISDLKRQRDALQRKIDSRERESTRRQDECDREINRLRNLLWQNLINPDSGEKSNAR